MGSEETIIITLPDRLTFIHDGVYDSLLATPIQRLGLAAYKKIRVINASPEIRETVDFIMDENTSLA